MTDASKQLFVPGTVDVSDLPEGVPADAAITRPQGGTGLQVDTVADLLDGLGRGAANGFAGLDDDGLVPSEQLPPSAPPDVMVGAAAGVSPDDDGEQGLVPKPLANQNLWPLRGDGTFFNELDLLQIFGLDKLYATSNPTKHVVKLSTFGDGDNGVQLVGRGSLTFHARIATFSTIDGDVDMRFDPKGAGHVTERGDPVALRMKGGRKLFHAPGSTLWQSAGVFDDPELDAISALTSAADTFPYYTGSGTAALATVTSAARNLLDDVDAAAQRATIGVGAIGTLATLDVGLPFEIDGGGVAITTGVKHYFEVPYAMTITGWTLLADQTGSIVIDVWKDTYANFPPVVGDTIAGSEKPTLSSAQKNQDLTLSSWTTSVAKGDILAINVDSAATVTKVWLTIRGTRVS